MIVFWVPGIPVQEGNLTSVPVDRIGADGQVHRGVSTFWREGDALKTWRNDIGKLAVPHFREERFERDGFGVGVKFLFVLPRPKSRAMRARWPDRRPDFDKLTRAVSDALEEIAYDNDKRVCEAFVKKWYQGDPAAPNGGDEAGVEIWVHELPGWPDDYKPVRR